MAGDEMVDVADMDTGADLDTTADPVSMDTGADLDTTADPVSMDTGADLDTAADPVSMDIAADGNNKQDPLSDLTGAGNTPSPEASAKEDDEEQKEQTAQQQPVPDPTQELKDLLDQAPKDNSQDSSSASSDIQNLEDFLNGLTKRPMDGAKAGFDAAKDAFNTTPKPKPSSNNDDKNDSQQEQNPKSDVTSSPTDALDDTAAPGHSDEKTDVTEMGSQTSEAQGATQDSLADFANNSGAEASTAPTPDMMG